MKTGISANDIGLLIRVGRGHMADTLANGAAVQMPNAFRKPADIDRRGTPLGKRLVPFSQATDEIDVLQARRILGRRGIA